MKNVLRFCQHITLNRNNRECQLSIKKYSSSAYQSIINEHKKERHPYKKIHPWKSANEFSESLVQSVFYNKNGLVALNKPYGISSRKKDGNDVKARYLNESLNKISGQMDYSIADSLPFIAKELGYSELRVVKSPERFMSGVLLLAANESVEKAIIKSHNRSLGLGRLPKTYWLVTTKLPKQVIGKVNLALKLIRSPCRKYERPVIVDEWSNLKVKSQEVKLLNVEYKVLSNSIDDLSSLIELKSSTTKWHAIRLFAATRLYSPILGDNIHGSRIQNIMGNWMTVNPFVDAVNMPPKLDERLLKVLNLSPAMQSIIPVHIHLKQFELAWYYGKDKDLIIQAPLPPEFSWTFQTLGFKLPETDSNTEEPIIDERQSVQVF